MQGEVDYLGKMVSHKSVFLFFGLCDRSLFSGTVTYSWCKRAVWVVVGMVTNHCVLTLVKAISSKLYYSFDALPLSLMSHVLTPVAPVSHESCPDACCPLRLECFNFLFICVFLWSGMELVGHRQRWKSGLGWILCGKGWSHVVLGSGSGRCEGRGNVLRLTCARWLQLATPSVLPPPV